jgi:hypothetical protein
MINVVPFVKSQSQIKREEQREVAKPKPVVAPTPERQKSMIELVIDIKQAYLADYPSFIRKQARDYAVKVAVNRVRDKVKLEEQLGESLYIWEKSTLLFEEFNKHCQYK